MDFKQTETQNGGLFEAYENGERIGYIAYTWSGADRFDILHTVVEPACEGKGIASALLNYAADFARKHNLKIHAVCSFAVVKFSRSAAYDDVKV